MENHTKRAVPDDFAVGVGDLLGLSSLAIGSNDLDYLVGIVNGWWWKERMSHESIGDDSRQQTNKKSFFWPEVNVRKVRLVER